MKKTITDPSELNKKMKESSELFNGLIKLAAKILDNSQNTQSGETSDESIT